MELENLTVKSDNSHYSFLGRGWNFPVFFDRATGEVAMASDFTDITQSLYILFCVAPGERVTQLEYGCDLYAHIFDPINAGTLSELKNKIQTAIDDFEPRIDVVSINIDDSNYLEGKVLIEITYEVRSTNTRHNIVFPFYKNEGTSLPEETL